MSLRVILEIYCCDVGHIRNRFPKDSMWASSAVGNKITWDLFSLKYSTSNKQWGKKQKNKHQH